MDNEHQSRRDTIWGVAIVNPGTGTLKALDSLFAQMHDSTIDELCGKTITDIMAPEGKEKWAAYISIVNQEGYYTFESIHLRGSGSRFPVRVFVTPVKGKTNDTLNFVLRCCDMTKFDQEEKTTFKLNERIAFLSEFFALFSFELRQPLSAVMGWIGVLRNGLRDKVSIDTAIESIDRSTKEQTRLIDMVDIVMGRPQSVSHPVDLEAVIMSAIDTSRPAAKNKGIQFEIVFKSVGQRFKGDPNGLQQVVERLLSNAIEYTPNDGTVQVKLERSDSSIALHVIDTGEAFETESLPYIFEKFSYSNELRARTNLGWPILNLAVVRHIVDSHGGTVQINNRVDGRGTIFTVSLPLLTPSTVSADAIHIHSKTGDEKQADLSSTLNGISILIVDDQLDSREVLRLGLQQRGATVKVAASATEALEILKHWKPDVLVSDIGMPGEDGYSLIRKVRALEQGQESHIPAVALTAWAREEDRQLALEAGYQEHKAKPVDPDDFIEVVVRLARSNDRLNKRGSHSQTPSID